MQNFSDYSDNELMLEIKHDDNNAFTELYYRYWEVLYNSAYKRMHDESISKDIIQDVFTDIWARRNSLEIENVAGYLFTAVRFQVLKFISKNKIVTPFLEAFQNIADASVKTDCNINQKEFNLLVNAWIETLPKKRRSIYILYSAEHLSTKEISQRLKISQKTVQNQLGTALHNLRSKIAHLLTLFL
jgi:RNA polymerase sigma-70 factor (family 1)